MRLSNSTHAFFSSLRAQLRTLGALAVRDAVSKYGHQNLGFFWLMAEPLVFAGAVMILWAFTQHGRVQEVGLVLFVLSGYCCLMQWRHIVSRSVRLLRNQSALIFHVNVRPLDLIASVSALEVVGLFAAFLIAYAPLVTFDFVQPPRDLLMVIGGWLIFGWFCAAVGLVVAGLSEIFEAVDKFVNAALYVLIPLTGTFTMVDWLPQQAQTVMLYSPLVNAIEIFRGGLFPADIATHYDVGYALAACFVTTAIGLQLIAYAQSRAETV